MGLDLPLKRFGPQPLKQPLGAQPLQLTRTIESLVGLAPPPQRKHCRNAAGYEGPGNDTAE